MERLTKMIKFQDGNETYDFSNEKCGEFLTDHKAGVRELFKRLCEYEDLEEHGLLMKLPCKIGSTVYVIVECKNIEGQLDGTLYSADGSQGTATGFYCPYEDNCPHDCEEFTSCEDYVNKKAVFEDTISLIQIDENGINVYTENCGIGGYIGEYNVFLTREEAEQSLEKINKVT